MVKEIYLIDICDTILNINFMKRETFYVKEQ